MVEFGNGFTWSDVYFMPTYLRKFYFNKLIETKKREAEKNALVNEAIAYCLANGRVFGEDGFNGIKLGPDPPGNAYVEFQKILLPIHLLQLPQQVSY